MTNKHLFELLEYDENLESVYIISQEDIRNGALFIRARLHYPDDEVTVPFVHYEGQDWVFTPFDWKGKLPETTKEIDNIEWRVNDTEIRGVLFCGLPILKQWVPDPNAGRIEDARVAIGRMVREARDKAGMTVRELAEKADISHSHIVRIEAGKYNVTVETLERLGKALGYEVKFVENPKGLTQIK